MIEGGVQMKDILYEEILKSVGDWIWAVDADGVYTYCSENVYDFLGFNAEEVVGKTPFDFMSEKEGLRVGEIFASHVAKKEQILQLQNVHIHKDGSNLIVETTGIPVLDENGDLTGYQGFDRDITEKIEIIKQNNTFEILFENSFDGMSILENNIFTQCNKKVVEMLKYNSKEELLNTHPSQLSPKFQPDGRASFEKAEEMMNLAIKNSGHRFEWVHTKADGENFWVEVVLTHISIVDRDIIHVVWRDISERKDMDNKLLLLNETLDHRVKEETHKNHIQQQHLFAQSRLAQIGEMISMIAHQWRQPISTIAMGANNILTDIELDSIDENSLRDEAKDILQMTQELSKTINDFGSFYKPNKQSVTIKLNDVIEKSLNIIKPSLINNNINIIEKYNCDEEIELYDGEIMQVILNILRNAQESFQEKENK